MVTRKEKLKTKNKLRLSVILYLFALLIRLYQLNLTAVYPDEITWMVKGKEFVYAIAKRNMDYFRTAWWNSNKDTYAIGIPVILPTGLSHITFSGSGKYSFKVLPDIIASRLPVVFVGSTMGVLIFLFGLTFLSPAAAFITGSLYAINPITIALDRWLLQDSFLTIFSFAAIVTFHKQFLQRKNSFIPGVLLALAFLVKPNGLLPAIAWLVYLFIGKNRRFAIELIFKNLISYFVTVSVLWPQVWITGPMAILEYLIRQSRLVNYGDPIPNYFLGHATINPNPIYYFFQIASRTPEVILILFITSFILYLKKIKSWVINPLVVGVSCYATVFLFLVSSAATKGGIRYVLPLFPWIYLSSGWVLDKIIQTRNRFADFIFTTIILLASYPILFFPNYYLYYNYFIGGPVNAAKVDLFGVCFGSKEALEYLDKNGPNGLTGVIGCSDTAPYHSNRPLTKNFKDAEILIVESSFVQSHPGSKLLLPIEKKKLIKEITQAGVVTARIYH